MDPVEIAVDIGRAAVLTAIKLAAPFLLTALAVGVIVSIIQAATQIQEQTLVFVPKILAMMVALYFFARYVALTLVGFGAVLFEQMPKEFP